MGIQQGSIPVYTLTKESLHLSDYLQKGSIVFIRCQPACFKVRQANMSEYFIKPFLRDGKEALAVFNEEEICHKVVGQSVPE